MFIRKERFGWLAYDPIEQKPIVFDLDELPEDIVNFCTIISNTPDSSAYLRAPISLYVYPSMKCNKNCSHCYFHNILNKDQVVIKASMIDRIVSLVKKYGIFTVNILGGEPMQQCTWPSVRRLLEQLLPLDVAVNITTNGLELQNYLEYLRGLRDGYPDLLTINVSFNPGDEKAAYGNKLIAALDAVAKNKMEINLNTVILNFELNDYQTIINQMQSIPSITRLNLLYPRTKNPPRISEYIEFCRKFVHLLGPTKINIETPFAHIYNGSKTDDTLFSNFHYGCGLGKRSLTVAPDGSVYACSTKVSGSDFFLGDIFENLETLWNRAYGMRLKKDLKLIAKKCENKCKYFKICESCLVDKLEGIDLLCEYAE